ncbi:MAG: hypothetical protein J6R01_08195 [Alistipes sp.]|nr:hypothetical protein [Alistipes sp.]
MTEQQLITWARSLSGWQVLGYTAIFALGYIAVVAIVAALSSLLPTGEDEYIEDIEEGGERDG